MLLWVTSILLGVILVGAPLAFGAVHQPAFLTASAVCTVLGFATSLLAVTGRVSPRPLPALALPATIFLIAAIQVVPIPAGVRTLLDPAGSELLALARLGGAQPMSLDPPATYLELAKAAAAMVAAAAALVLASGRRHRFVSVGLVACAGLVALGVGLGHRAAAEDKIYGLFGHSRGLPIGPFINPNHTAELLELSAFAALAFAFARTTLGGQRLWKILSAVLAAGALSTLSRGSVLALASGALTFFLLAPKSEDGEPFRRSKFAAMLVGLLVVLGVAISLGADKLIGVLAGTGGDNLTKVTVWLDALNVFRAHPAGIGLGAFARVYPVYKTLPVFGWFQFPENQPVGLLVEGGIAGAVLVLLALGWTIRRLAKNSRRDGVEAALAAGLVAVIVHNFVDFGLETLGVLLPFCALLGAMVGRQTESHEQQPRAFRVPVAAGLAVAATLVGMVLLHRPSARNFDELLRPPIHPGMREIAHDASIAHPTDFAYALAEARMEPRTMASLSSRLRMLNRAILLCRLCSSAHAEAARDLWRLGRRQQALLEWKSVLALAPRQLWQVFDELVRSGAKQAELVSLANDGNRFELGGYLLDRELMDAARETLAGAKNRDTVDYHLVETRMAIAAKDLPSARAATRRALAIAPQDSRVVLAAADVEARANANDQAIQILQRGLAAEPANVQLNRRLLELLMQTDKWTAIDRALDGLRRALAAGGAGMAEANIAAARVFERRGQYRRAVSEYQAALAQNPDDVGWSLALGRAAEQSGSIAIAVDAYNTVLRRTPDHPEARAALARIERDKRLFQAAQQEPSHTVEGGR